MKTAIYIRVSTEEQVKEGYSISAQKQKLKAYCIAQDWTIAGFYVDEGISAKDTNRPQLQQMIRDIKDGKIECVLVYRLDRLTRSVLDLYNLLEVFEDHDCKFKSATEVYDTTTAMGRMFITIVAALAQWERENLGERVRMGFAEKVRQGKYAHNISPYGYDLDLTTGILTINEEEADIFKHIVELYLGGKGANSICKYLNKRNITTKKGNLWNDTPLMKMLKNPLYCGTIKWGDVETEDSVPKIIDKETFNQIQDTFARRRNQHPRNISSQYLFTGVLYCPACKSRMSGQCVYHNKPKTGELVIYLNYRCEKSTNSYCEGKRNVSEIRLEKAFLSYIEKIDFTSIVDEVAATGEAGLNNDNTEIEVDKLQKELIKIKKRKKKWQYAWANDTITDEDFNERMEEENNLEEEINNTLESYLVESPKEKINTEEIAEVLKNIKMNWNNLETGEKKNFIQTFIERIEVGYDDKNRLYVDSIDFY